jgi:Uma2 family endonuclease
MATALAVPPITIEQYLGFEGYPGLRDELINGKIALSPQPKPHHQQVVKNLFLILHKAFESSSFTVQMNSNIRFDRSNSMPAPDIFVVQQDIWYRAIQEDRYLSEPPLLAAEVISPANRHKRVQEKIEIYAKHGVEHIWVLHPKKLQASAARKTNGSVRLESFDRIWIDSPVHIEFLTADLFKLA